jgi:hypothetical protein
MWVHGYPMHHYLRFSVRYNGGDRCQWPPRPRWRQYPVSVWLTAWYVRVPLLSRCLGLGVAVLQPHGIGWQWRVSRRHSAKKGIGIRVWYFFPGGLVIGGPHPVLQVVIMQLSMSHTSRLKFEGSR